MGDQVALHAPRDSELSQEDEEDGAAGGTHFNTESLIESQLAKEHQLLQEVKLLNKQVH